MNDLINILKYSPFEFDKRRKEKFFQNLQKKLTNHHFAKCKKYFKILNLLKYKKNNKYKIFEFPFLPVRLFKKYNLISLPKKNIVKTITSSGTSGETTSKIFLDRQNSDMQIKVLAKIITNYIGHKRLPLLIIDTKSTATNRKIFSARGAAILGFSIFGYDITYALNDDLSLNVSEIDRFFNKYKNNNCLIFGFTYLIWQNFYKNLIKLNKKCLFKNGIVLHGGGWKKMDRQKVSNVDFKKSIKKMLGVKNIFNYYGMAEQTGSIFVECEKGFLHCSIFSDILIRDKKFVNCKFNEYGLIQLLSLLPTSYPGHNILSEDLGKIVGEDDCKCGRLGKYFIVKGRLKDAELRGCSDV
tara:strand:- start:2631 stop:3695 length:1065 start_codon:yes stop_codon:yes gene_type:complete